MKFKLGTVIFWIVVVAVYVTTRLINLKIIPIFTDEAIYSYWAQVALHDPQHRFISLEDGKQPLFIWLAAIMQKFIEDPLIATRIVSVLSGFGSIIGIYLLSKSLFKENVAKISVIIYLVIPFTLLYNRLALFDSLLTMFGIFAVYLSVMMAKKPDIGIALLNGFAIGLAIITKSSGSFFLYLLPVSAILIGRKGFMSKFIKWSLLSSATVVLSLLIYNSLRLSPLFYLIARKNLEFIRSPQEVIQDPFIHFLSNLNAIIGWFITYLSLPLFIISVFSILFVMYKRNNKGIYLVILVFVPLLAELLFNKVLYVRFILFYTPYIIILAAFFIQYLYGRFKVKNNLKYLVMVALLAWPGLNSFRLITRPTAANIPSNDSEQYLNSWPAGYGVEEVVQILKSESRDKVIYVATEGTFGLLPYALNIYFYQNTNVEIRAFWPLNPDDLPEQIIQLAEDGKTFVIFYQTQKPINNPKLKLINSYRKGVGDSYLRIYEVIN